ncbi:MAG: prolyl oligopeptidase family serine peptidase [Proteobacteria bacterium]|nr:prolyl oligopeptidase family serine peptidase [Pseudomonadota bacterium]
MFIQGGRRGMLGFGKTFRQALYNSSTSTFLEDIACLIRALHTSKEALKLEKIFLMGASFDGTTALSIATQAPYKDLPIDGFITLGGVFNIGKFFQQHSSWDNPLKHVLNPIENLSNLSKPFLVLHGDFDEQAPLDEVFELREKKETLGASLLQIHVLKGANHQLDNTSEALLASTEGIVNFCRTGKYFLSKESLI